MKEGFIVGFIVGIIGAVVAELGVRVLDLIVKGSFSSKTFISIIIFIIVILLLTLPIAALRENHIIPTNSDKRTSAFANLRTFYFNLLLRTIGIVVVVFFLNEFLSLLSSQGFFSSPSFLSFLSQWPSFMGFLTTVLLWAIGAGLMAYILYLMVRIIKDD